jgi:hypothetical protein
MLSTNPLADDVSSANEQVVGRNSSNKHPASTVNSKISTNMKYQIIQNFSYLHFAWFNAVHCTLTSN